MAPMPPRRQIAKDRFSTLFGALKTQPYVDPPVRPSISYIHRTISWNHTGTLIATGATDKTIRVWNPERTNPKSQIELKGHTHAVEKVLFNPVKEFELASCSGDGTVRFWDVKSRTCTHKLDVGGEAFTLAWSVDGTILMVGLKNDTLIPIQPPSNSNPSPTILSRHPQPLQTNQTAFSFAHPPRDLLLTHGDGTVKVLDFPTLSPLHTLAAHTSACTSLALSLRGNYLAIGGSDALISLWDTTEWVCRRTMSNASSGGVRSLSWSFDGRFLVGASEEVAAGGGAGGRSEGVEIYHAETGEVVYTIATGTSSVPAVEWHPHRYWLAYTQVEDLTGKSVLKIIGPAGGPSI